MAVLEYQQPELVPRRSASGRLLISGVSGSIAGAVAFFSWSSSLVLLVVAATPILALPALAVKYLGLSPSKGLTQLFDSTCASVQFAVYGLLATSRFRGKLGVVAVIVVVHLVWLLFIIHFIIHELQNAVF